MLQVDCFCIDIRRMDNLGHLGDAKEASEQYECNTDIPNTIFCFFAPAVLLPIFMPCFI